MKWIIGTVVVLFAGWYVATRMIDQKGAAQVTLNTTDSQQAKKPMDSSANEIVVKDSLPQNQLRLPEGNIHTKGVQPQEVVAFAKTLMGTPYLYGSTDPAKGFDCSGFITYVFKHFGIVVPRSSIDFTNVGTEVSAAQAREGDLILFTGTDSTEKFVGHMGIVVSNTDTLHFIHSTSGKQHGVTITPLSHYYKSRYVKTVRIFP